MAHRVLTRWAAFALLVLLPSIPGPARGEVPVGRTIVEVTSDPIPDLDAVALSGLTPGEPLTEVAAFEAIRALWSTGRVRDVRVLARPVVGGVAVRLSVSLSQTVRRLELGGNRALDRREVIRATGYIAGESWRPEDAERMAGALRDAYRERGYPEAQVEVEADDLPGDPEGVAIRVTVVEGEPVRLADVALRGNLGLPEPELREALGLEPGDVYDRVALREGLDALLDLYRREGYYQARIDRTGVAAVVSSGGDARLVVPVESGDRFEVAFFGERLIPDDALRAALRLEEERELSRAVIATLEERIRDHYQRLGFHHVRVDSRVTRLRPGHRRLSFRIRPGPRVLVHALEFDGNEQFSDAYLRRQVVALLQERLAPSGLFQQIGDDELNDLGISGERREPWRPGPRRRGTVRPRPARTYVAAIYRDALEHIRNLYGAHGYLQASLGEPELSFSDRGRSLEVRVRIDEGPQTRIRSITFANNSALDDERITRVMRIEPADPLSRYDAEQARRRIITMYRSHGYMYVAVDEDEHISEDGLWADLTYLIDEGDQVMVGEVRVRGHDATRLSLIRDRIRLRPGDVYTPVAAQRSEQALIELGIFSTVSVSLVEPQTPGPIKDVLVEVVERRPQSLEARVGFSSADGPRGSLRYGVNNIGGYAIAFDARIALSYQVFFFGTPAFERFVADLPLADRLERLIVASLSLPHLPRLGRIVGLRLDATHERNNDPAFAVTRYGTSLALSGGYRPLLTAQLQTGFEFLDVAQVQELPDCYDFPEEERDPGNNCLYPSRQNLLLSRAPQGSSWLWVTRALLSLDLRDNPFSPRRGFYASVSAEHVHSIRPIVEEITTVDPVTEERVTEEVSRSTEIIRLSMLASGYVPLGFLDWVLALSVRFGWVLPLTRDSFTFADRYFYLGGVDNLRGWPEESVQAADLREPGGNSMLLLRAELRIPVRNSFGVALFADAGSIWRRQEAMFDTFTLRPTVGLGLRYSTPVGPVVLDLAWAIPRAKDLARAREDLITQGLDSDDLDMTPYYTPFVHFSIGVF